MYIYIMDVQSHTSVSSGWCGCLQLSHNSLVSLINLALVQNDEEIKQGAVLQYSLQYSLYDMAIHRPEGSSHLARDIAPVRLIKTDKERKKERQKELTKGREEGRNAVQYT